MKKLILSLGGAALASMLFAAEMELTTSIPKAEISGTPVPIEVPNLEPLQQSVPTMMVAEGTVNLAAGKPVTSSDDYIFVGELSYVTDGDKETAEGFYVELYDGLQWVQIDLESSSVIEAVWVWHFHGQKRAYHDVIVQISDDPEFADGVTTIFNNDFDNSAEMGTGKDRPYIETNFGKLIDAKGVSGRYVRLYSNGSTAFDSNQYIEVEVFGLPAGE
jgi:hypothetical protein